MREWLRWCDTCSRKAGYLIEVTWYNWIAHKLKGHKTLKQYLFAPTETIHKEIRRGWWAYRKPEEKPY